MVENTVELPKKTTADAGSFSEFKRIVKGESIPATPAVEVPETPTEAAPAPEKAEPAPPEQGKQESQEKQEAGKPREKNATTRASELAEQGRFKEANAILKAAHDKEMAELRKQLDDLRAPKPVAPAVPEVAKPQAAKPAEDAEPKVADFADKPYEDYVRALARWEYRQEAKAERERSTQQQAQQTLQQRATAARAKYPDFDQTANVVGRTGIPLPDAMGQFVLHSEQGMEILYHLGQNTAEYARIAQLPPIRQAAELAWIERAVQAPAAPQAQPEQPKPFPVSKVPPPPGKVGGMQPPTPISSRDAATFEEFKAAELARKAGRSHAS